ncbi:hypothetical protein P4U24_02325 [Aeribacillus composti]|uniref:hypothetical protein n=1 Tax=Aeribacillus composti TaxID=1868734 RepID=UPI002E231F12|nr:hypothetical protein [Aeribacillus composti]
MHHYRLSASLNGDNKIGGLGKRSSLAASSSNNLLLRTSFVLKNEIIDDFQLNKRLFGAIAPLALLSTFPNRL